MLHRSFKPAKCKTSLKLAVSRIKLLKNKRDSQLKQMKRELAQLLETGQTRTAMIRVEHVVREEKTMAAYDLIEIYCELIVARLPMIESQKHCPIDLKEAVTSVIFAAPRCADIPELLDVRKHFKAKYGKEFVNAAVELHPECGVGRMLIEKLSARAPDGQTKIKILKAIAEEHTINWDPESVEEKEGNPTQDLLNGPSSFARASEMSFEPQNVQAPPSYAQKHDAYVPHHEQSESSSPSTQSFASTDFGGTTTVGVSDPRMRTPRTAAEGTELRHSYSGNESPSSRVRENWPMEFKDATAAAEAAAESAERASMAARAAAELATGEKIRRQYSVESQKLPIYGLRNEGPGKYSGSKMHDDNVYRDLANNSFHSRDPRTHNVPYNENASESLGKADKRYYSPGHAEKSNHLASQADSKLHGDRLYTDSEIEKIHYDLKTQIEQVNENESETLTKADEEFYGQGHADKSNFSASLKSSKASIDDDIIVSGLNKRDGHYHKTYSGVGSTGMKKQYSDSEDELLGNMHNGAETDDIEYVGEENFGKQSSSVASRLHSSNFDYDHDDILHSNYNIFAGVDPFVGRDQENLQADSDPFHSYSNNMVFDKSDSDEEDKLDIGGIYKRQESKIFVSPSRLHTYFPENENPRNTRQTTTDSPGVSSSQSYFVTDEHSLPDSETLGKTVIPTQPDYLPPVTFDDSDGGPTSGSGEEPESDKLSDFPKHQMSPIHTKFPIDSSTKDRRSSHSAFDEHNPQKSPQHPKLSLFHEVQDNLPTDESPYTVKGDEFLDQSSSESGKELNLGMLSGGFRNRGFRHPPYTKNPSSNATSSPSKQAAEIHSITSEQSYSSSITENSLRLESYNQKSTKADKKTSSRLSVTEFDSDGSDPEQEAPLRISRNSRATPNQKAAAAVSGRLSPKSQATYFNSNSVNTEEDNTTSTSARKSPLGSGLSRRTKLTYHSSQKKPSRGTSPTEEAYSRSLPESKVSTHEEATKPSTSGKTHSPPSRTVPSSSENSKPSSSGAQPPSRGNSSKQASHVHPKLPDYEDITAHLNSLRLNRK